MQVNKGRNRFWLVVGGYFVNPAEICYINGTESWLSVIQLVAPDPRKNHDLVSFK